MHFSKAHKLILSSSLSVFLAGCGSPNYSPSEMHLTVEEVDSTAPKNPSAIPELVKVTPTVPQMSNEKGADTFDVVVTNVPVRDLLFALARDANINMDVDSAVGGLVTMSALDQTLDAILDRIAAQIAIRVDRQGNALIIKNDEPYYQRYHVDYTSVTRTFSSNADVGGLGGGSAIISNASSNAFWENLEDSIASILGVDLESAGAGALADPTASENRLLADSDSFEARFSTDNSYDFNPDTGILLVYAPERLQKEVSAYLDEALSIARRQVLLEATVVEVVLNNEYRQGINWSAFNQFAKEGLSLYQGNNVGGAAALINQIVEEIDFDESIFIPAGSLNEGSVVNSPEYLRFVNFNRLQQDRGAKIDGFTSTVEEITDDNDNVLGYTVNRIYTQQQVNQENTELRAGGLIPTNSVVPGASFTAAYRTGDVSAAVELLDTFGDAKVLSSPRISVLNNQPALLRVVDQEVYFSVEVNETINEATGQVSGRTFDITENTVDVGFSMNVLPHISQGDEVFLNLKPAVTRVLSYRRAPTPSAVGEGGAAAENFVPITRIREMESVLSLRSGEIAVMGGLLEDRTGDNNTAVPGLSELPGIGTLFENKQESTFKTEFVVFIKARIITNPSIHADYADYRELLPDSEFIIRDRADTALPPRQKKAR